MTTKNLKELSLSLENEMNNRRSIEATKELKEALSIMKRFKNCSVKYKKTFFGFEYIIEIDVEEVINFVINIGEDKVVIESTFGDYDSQSKFNGIGGTNEWTIYDVYKLLRIIFNTLISDEYYEIDEWIYHNKSSYILPTTLNEDEKIDMENNIIKDLIIKLSDLMGFDNVFVNYQFGISENCNVLFMTKGIEIGEIDFIWDMCYNIFPDFSLQFNDLNLDQTTIEKLIEICMPINFRRLLIARTFKNE